MLVCSACFELKSKLSSFEIFKACQSKLTIRENTGLLFFSTSFYNNKANNLRNWSHRDEQYIKVVQVRLSPDQMFYST